MSPETTKPRGPSRAYFKLSRGAARTLSVVALGSLLAWFVLKFFLTPDNAALQLTVGVLALVGMISCVVMFLSTYNFRAHAPDTDIDERELAERNRAYVLAYQLVWLGLLAGYVALEFGGALSDAVFNRHVASNYLTVLMFAALVLPGCLLAWWDPGESA
ncbi:MAG: hypothetical protein RL026_1233 [Pseudomonadota bacterium]|jgi:hypothetical protein